MKSCGFFFLVLSVLLSGLGCRKPSLLQDSGVVLNDYQRSVLNNFFTESDDIKNRMQVYFDQYGVPVFDEGIVTVYTTEQGDYAPFISLRLEDSIIVELGYPDLESAVEYDQQGNLIRILKMNYAYEGDRLKTATNGVADWVFNYDNDCIIRQSLPGKSGLKETKKYCYDTDENLLFFEWSNNRDSTVYTEYFEYDKGSLVEMVYLKTQGKDTLIESREIAILNDMGMISNLRETIKCLIVNETQRDSTSASNEFQIEYHLLDQTPLTIRKSIYEEDRLSVELIFTFNEYGHLIECFSESPKGRNFRLVYERQE